MFLTLSFLVFTTHRVLAYARPENCPKLMSHLENLQIVSSYESDRSECWFSIDDNNAYQTMIYRSYLLTSSGMLMVFNSYGNGPSSTHTGAREFFFFPREEFFNKIIVDTKALTIPINHLATFKFETTRLRLIEQPNLKFATDSKVNRQNRGGVEVIKYAGVYLDAGFQMGQSPTQNPENKSRFINPQKQICVVKNKDVFDYKNDDMFLRGDSVLKKTVQVLCPQFIW
jgi:hypothetical protein